MENVFTRRFAIRRLGSIVAVPVSARRIRWQEETHASNGSAGDRPSSLTISSGLFQDSDQAAVVTIMAVPTKEVRVRSIHLGDAKVVAGHLVVDGRSARLNAPTSAPALERMHPLARQQ